MKDKRVLIQEILINFFSEPFIITSDIITFFESTYGIFEIHEIKNILYEEPQLLNLIIYPDKNLLKKILLVCPLSISQEDIQIILNYLEDNIQAFNIKLRNQRLLIPASRIFFNEFLSKLRLDIEIPPALYNIIKKFPVDTYIEILMELKKQHISWNPNMESFFEMFFLKFRENKELIFYLKTLLSLFKDNSSVYDIKNAMLKRVYTLHQALENQISTMDKIDTKGLEFVLTSRTPILCVSSDVIHREIKTLEHIFSNLFPDST